MEAAASINLTDLPLEMKIQIALCLSDINDLFSLSLTEKSWNTVISSNYFWQRYVYLHTPLRDLDPSLDFREVYKDYFRNRYKMAVVDMTVVWLNNRYIYKEAHENSFSGHIVYLYFVCWLDICGTFQDVYPGEYELVWRIMLRDNVEVYDPTTIMASSGEKSVKYTVEEEKWQKWISTFGSDEWFEIITGCILIEEKGPVEVRFQNHSDNWKQGVYWDYVNLRPVSKKTKDSDKISSRKKIYRKRKK